LVPQFPQRRSRRGVDFVAVADEEVHER
jgi:hypothetical protein